MNLFVRAVASLLFLCTTVVFAQEVSEDLQGRASEDLKALRGSNGSVDLSALKASLSKRKQMLTTAAPQATASAAAVSWQEIGPDNIGGRVRSLAVHPTVAGRLFAGSAGGGIWQSNDSGAHWSQIGTQMTNYAVTHIVIAKSDSVIYAATGENFTPSGNGQVDALPGGGIFKSADGGNTWNVLQNTVPQFFGDQWTYVSRLWVHPTNSNIVLAGTFGGLYKSIDGGSSWQLKSTSITNQNVCDIASNPTNPNQILIGYCEGYADRSNDGGETWSNVATIPYTRAVFAWSTSSPNIVYAADHNDINGTLYVSTDYGQTFARKNGGIGTFWNDNVFQSNYDSCIWVDPTNAQNIVVGGVYLIRSIDGGTSFQTPTAIHGDYHTIVAGPNYDGLSHATVFVSNDGGVNSNDKFFATDVNVTGSSWVNLTKGLRITQFYSISANNVLVNGGTQDNGLLLRNWVPGGAGMTWSQWNGGDGGMAPLSNNQAYQYYAFGEGQNGAGPFELDPQGHFIGRFVADSGLWVTPLLIDDGANSRLLYGGQNLWELANPFDLSSSWQILAPSSVFSGWPIEHVAVSPSDSNIIWVDAGGVLFSSNNATNGSPTFTPINTSFGGNSSLHISKFSSHEGFATFAGPYCCVVFRTTNDGVSWTDISGNLPHLPVLDIAQSPWDPSTLYVATYAGVYATGDMGTNWAPVGGNGGPDVAATWALTWRGNQLVAATHGRGVFVGSILPNDLTIAESDSGSFYQGQTNATYTLTVTNVGAAASSGTVTVVDTLPANGLVATSISSADPSWSCVLATLTCTRSDILASGASYSPITLTVKVATNAPASVTNSATVSEAADTTTNNNSATDTTSIVPKPELLLTGPASSTFIEGSTGSYTLTVNNTGGASTSGTVTVTDILPAGLTPTSANAGSYAPCPISGQTVTCTQTSSLGTNQSYTISIQVSVAVGAAPNLVNTASLSGGGDVTPADNSVSIPTTVVQKPDLQLTGPASSTFTQGATGRYTLTVNNIGGASTSGTVTMTDTLPAGLTPTSASAGSYASCPISGQTVTCTQTSSLGANQSYAISIQVSVAINAAPSLVNTASLTGGGDITPADNSVSIPTTVTQEPNLTITKSHVGNFAQGQIGATYSLTIKNVGFAATNATVTVTDTLPSGLTATAIDGTGWSCPSGGLTCTRSNALAANASYAPITVTVNVAPNAAASVINSATVSGGGEIFSGDDSASDTTTITPQVDLVVSSSHIGNFDQNSSNTYTLAVSNIGGAPTNGTSVSVVDTLPTGISFLYVSGSGWNCSYTDHHCTRSDVLAGGQSYPPITLYVAVAPDAPPTVTNIVKVSGGGDATTTDNTSNDTTTITQQPRPTVTVSHTGNFSQGQTNAQYTLTVTNAALIANMKGTTKVTESAPSMAVISMSGTGWTCPTSAYPSAGASCSRTDTLPPGQSYPPITATMYVAPTAPSNVINSVSVQDQVTLGQTFSSSTSDPTTINPLTLSASPDVAAWIDSSGIPSVENVSTTTFSNVHATVTISFQTEGLVFTPVDNVCSLTSTGQTGSVATYDCVATSLAPGAGAQFGIQCNSSASTQLQGTISVSLITPTTPADTSAVNNSMSASIYCSANSM